MRRLAALALAALAPLGAHAHAQVGTQVENVELATAAGGKERLLAPKMKATAIVFVRTEQERSVEALKAMATCERDLAGKPVRFVAVISGETPPAEARALAAATGVRMPFLLDANDALYQRLEVRLHPVVFLLDGKNRVASFEMYRQIDYCDVVRARLRFLIGELDQAALDAILEPPRNTMPGEDVRDVSKRDVNLGRRQLAIKQYDKALASARKALEKAPSAAAFALIGDVHAARGDCAQALQQYEQALKLDPAEEHAVAGKAACAAK
jgi:tetratricopeptide (TPR) repeat protein